LLATCPRPDSTRVRPALQYRRLDTSAEEGRGDSEYGPLMRRFR
jgi:hypothetical protein